MMDENIISNPFVGCTARDMKYSEVSKYWCKPFSLYKLNENELFSSKTPIVIEGVRGTGKTMILKYLSYAVQKDLLHISNYNDSINFVIKRSFGVYFRYKADFCRMFEELKCDIADRQIIFQRYFELFIVRQIINQLIDFYAEDDTREIEKCISNTLRINDCSLTDSLTYVNKLISGIDSIINMAQYDKEWLSIFYKNVGKQNLLTETVARITNSVSGWREVLFVVLLDEYENLGNLQPVINTLIKQVDETTNLTYRIGVRPAGMELNNATSINNERLQVDRDFLLKKLVCSNFSDYKKFALEISQKRLANTEVYKMNKLCDITKILGKKEDIDAEAKSIAKGNKQFKILADRYDANKLKEVVSELTCDNKLLEMYNILLVSRGYEYKKVGEICDRYLKMKEKKQLSEAEGLLHKYVMDYSNKYRLTLLYMLITIYGERKQYYSFNTFCYLSSGSINDYISLCRSVFKYIDEETIEQLKKGNRIDNVTQTNAALDVAEDQRRKMAMGNRFGQELFSFIENIGSIFESYHRDLGARYPETNQFAFEDENQVRTNKELYTYLIELVNSGAIIKKPNRQLKSVGKNRGVLYQLNRILAPIYQFSYRTRGGYNLVISTEDFRQMLKSSVDPQKYINNANENYQFKLTDYIGED